MASGSQANDNPAVTAANNTPSCFAGFQPFDAPTVDPPQNAVTIPEYDMLARLPHFSFKNGVPGQAVSLLVKATIPSAYYWRPVRNLPPARAKEYPGVFVRTAYLGLWDNKPAELPDAKVMKVAILLGIARAVVTSFYEVNDADLIPGEVGAPIFSASQIGGGKYVFTAEPNLSPSIMAHINDDTTFSNVTRNVIPSIHMSAIGLPAMQGWSLMMTGHHYLSDGASQSRRAYAVIERQFWKANNVATWWSEDLDIVTDALWHKACHPMSISLKYRWATSESVREMIVTAGAGSAAARLPAKETELRAANSYLVLLQTVRSMYESYGGSLDFSVLTYANELAKSYPHDDTLPQTAISRLPGTPPWIVDRRSALRFLDEVMVSNADVAAHAFGFYIAMTDQNTLMGTAAANDTIKTSFSLLKLKNQSTAAYTAGYQTYSDYSSFKARQRQSGEYQPINLAVRYLDVGPVPDGAQPQQ